MHGHLNTFRYNIEFIKLNENNSDLELLLVLYNYLQLFTVFNSCLHFYIFQQYNRIFGQKKL